LGQPLEDIHSLEPRQVKVEEDEVGGFLLDEFKTALPVTGRHGPVSARVQAVLQHCDDVLVIVDDEDFALHRTSSGWET
jgi:hypothetical protein